MINTLPDRKPFSDLILAWYDRHARTLPWRSPPGVTPDPYHVWLSEIMLQQTTVATVGPYFQKFLKNWPRVQDMAAAPLDDILTNWAGLGYYARARNLHKCAIEVSVRHDGRFPDDHATLLTLPGIGPYTAAAIAAIAFDRPETVVDGNIERVISRLFRIATALPAAKKEITREAGFLTPTRRAGDYAQALMDLGAMICTPRNPACCLCPVRDLCAAYRAGDMEAYPVKAPRKEKPTRQAVVFWMQREDGRVFLRRRAETGLLGGMMEFPSSDWQEAAISPEAAVRGFLGNEGNISPVLRLAAPVRHTFTHFHLLLQPIILHGGRWPQTLSDGEGVWLHPGEFADYALPTLMRKVARAVLEREAGAP
ncbi:A/G-specific adenine glycosylase [Sneathiella sp.]|uniref:A/G-specific adenine glycosylase n=1 Tax=Sneathiella sp. TaxID=1964365 RepID=UPI002FDFCC07